MECRSNCGACCIIPSISTKTRLLPEGKPSFVPCIHLDESLRCKIFFEKERPKVCASLTPTEEMCGTCKDDAMRYLTWLEEETKP